MMDSLNWTDTVILIAAVAVFVLGLVKGFVWQVTRLITIIGGCVLANRYSGDLAPTVRRVFPSLEQPVDRYIAYFLIFVGVAILVSLLAYLLRHVIESLQLGTYDRVFGGALGLINGAVVLMLVVLGLGALAERDILFEEKAFRETVQASELLPPTYRFVRELTVLFPSELRDLADQALREGEEDLQPGEEPSTGTAEAGPTTPPDGSDGQLLRDPADR